MCDNEVSSTSELTRAAVLIIQSDSPSDSPKCPALTRTSPRDTYYLPSIDTQCSPRYILSRTDYVTSFDTYSIVCTLIWTPCGIWYCVSSPRCVGLSGGRRASGFQCRPIGPQLSRTQSSPRNLPAHRQHPSRTRRQSRACPACVRARLEAIHFIR